MDNPNCNLLYEKLSKIVPIIGEINHIGLPKPLSFPKIVVIGHQSSGKTSILEALIGMDFLPIGHGVVTTRPIEIQMINIPEEDSDKPYVMFEDLKDKKFVDLNLVRERILSLSGRHQRFGSRYSEAPIKLSLHSSSCPNLTVVDTLGLFRFNYSGNIPPDEAIANAVARKYCREENTLILCVLPANADMQASDAQRLSWEIDPHGYRTIGVITKIDIMDRGTNARKMVLGEEVAMRLGYVGLKCLALVNMGVQTLEQCRIEQKLFFNTHPVYCRMPRRYFCADSLAQKISNVFATYFRGQLSDIIRDTHDKMRVCENKLKDIDHQDSLLNKDGANSLWLLISKFIESFKQNLRGQYVDDPELAISLENTEVVSIRSLFSELYSEYSGFEYQASFEYSDDDIAKAMIMHNGDSIPGFPSIDAFLYLLHPLLEKLCEPALKMTDAIFHFLEGQVTIMIEKVFSRGDRFSEISNFIQEACIKQLKVHYDKTRKIVDQLLDSEQNYLYYSDVGSLANKIDPEGRKDDEFIGEKMIIKDIRGKLDDYFSVICRNLRDSVPKIIGTFLVREYQDQLQFVLFNEVNSELFSESRNRCELSLNEKKSIIETKTHLEKILGTAEKATSQLEELGDQKERASFRQENSKEYLMRIVEDAWAKFNSEI